MLSRKRRIEEKLKQDFGRPRAEYEMDIIKKRKNLIQILYEEMQEEKSDYEVDQVTWSDLQLDEVFARFNHTKSYIGEQFLYHQLHVPKQSKGQREVDEAQRQLLSKQEMTRLELEKRLLAIGKEEGAYYLPYFLTHAELWSVKKTWMLYLLQGALVALLIAAMFYQSYGVFMALLLSVGTNLLVYLRMKNQYEVFLYSLGTIKQILQFGKYIITDQTCKSLLVPGHIVKMIKELIPLSNKIMWWNTRKMMVFSGDISGILQDYLCGITLLDMTMFNRIMKVVNGKQQELLELFCYIGKIDVNLAIASYRKSIPYYCRPLVEDGKDFRVKGLVHPLLESGIRNDFRLNRRAIITGGNAAGKSTFMKAVALNVIMAKSINTCTAEEFQVPDLTVMTSMALRDDVLHGESFYFREAKRLKQMLDASSDQKDYLFVIDEMLKGTNTVERVAAATSILNYFVNTNQYLLVATHDLDLVENLKDYYEDYYFESIVKMNDISFDYKIHSGKGGSTNAIALLGILNYPKEIVLEAQKLIQ